MAIGSNALWKFAPVGKGSVAAVRKVPLKEGVEVDYVPVIKHGNFLGKVIYNAYALISYATDRVIRPGYGTFSREEKILSEDGGVLYPQLVSPEERESHLSIPADIAEELKQNPHYIYKFITGDILRDVLTSHSDQKYRMLRAAGETLARVHNRGNILESIHGDYTLENGIYTPYNDVRPIDPGVVLNEQYASTHIREAQARDIVLFGLSLASTVSENQKEYLHAFLDGYVERGGSKEVIEEAKKYSLFKMFPNWIRFAFLEKLAKKNLGAGEAQFDVHKIYREAIQSY